MVRKSLFFIKLNNLLYNRPLYFVKVCKRENRTDCADMFFLAHGKNVWYTVRKHRKRTYKGNKMTKKFFYCEKCGSCRANDERDAREEMSCPFCENAMTFKGNYDWAATSTQDRNKILENWKNEATENGVLNDALFNAREHQNATNAAATAKQSNSTAQNDRDAIRKAQGLERIGPILRSGAKGIGFFGMLLTLALGICLAIFGGSSAMLVIGIGIAVIGPFVSFVSILVLYGLGELIVRMGEVSMNTR